MTRHYFQSTRNLILLCSLLVVLGLMAGWFILLPRADASLQSLRGTIYDRSGKELAVSYPANSLYANPREVQDPEGLTKKLAPMLNMSEDTLRRRLKAQGTFVWLKRALDPDKYNRIADFLREEKVRGLDFFTESRRVYPNAELAAHALGFVGTDDKGLAGIELSMDPTIKGLLLQQQDKSGQGARLLQSVFAAEKPKQASSLHLTLDSAMQAAVEQALDNALARTKAHSATMLVMNPKTGEILAMASRPAFNPNVFFCYPEKTWRNPAILSIQLTAATIKELLGDAGALDGNSERFQSYAEAFGFGKPTGIELPGEEAGSVSAVAVTPLQLLTAFSALANDGKLLKPQIIKEIRDGAGKPISSSSPQWVRQAVTPEMAHKLFALLEKHLTEGGGNQAAAAGYRFAGKSFSAGRLGAGGSGADPERSSDSFVGLGPLEDVKLAGLVVIDTTGVQSVAGETAAPVFAEAMDKIARLGK